MRRPGQLAAALFVFALTAAVAWPTLHYGFVYDDEAVVLERRPVQELGLRDFLASRPHGTGRHLTALTLDFDRANSGTGTETRCLSPNSRATEVPAHCAAPYHRTNVLLAGLLSLLVFALLSRSGLSLAAAKAGAAIFAVHPVHADAVAWITARSETLSALGVVAVLLLALRPAKETHAPSLRIALGSAFFASLAVHSKENALCLPLLLLAARVFLGSRVALAPSLGGVLLAFTGWALLVLGRLDGLAPPQLVDNPLLHAPLIERVPKALAILWDYARLLVVPFPLMPDRSWAATDPSMAAGWIAAAAWLAAGIGVLAIARRAPLLAFALAFFPLAFAVTGNVARPIGTLMAERLLMLPSISIALLAGIAFDSLAKSARGRTIATVAAGIVVLVFFALFRDRASVWRDGDTYFAASAAAAPRSAKAQYDYGAWLLRKNEHAAADAAFARALEIFPAFARAAHWQAEARQRRGDSAGAAGSYLAYLETTPGDPAAMRNLVGLLLAAKRHDEAKAWAEKLVHLLPGDQGALELLISTQAAAERAARKPAVSP